KREQGDRGHVWLTWQGEDSAARKEVRASGVFDQMVPELDKALNLPHDVPVTFLKCGEDNAFYDPEKIAIQMCDELVDYYAEMFADYQGDERKEAVVGS